MAVLVEGRNASRRRPPLVGMVTLHQAPFVVLASLRPRSLEVDLLPHVLPDVPCPQIARLPVERVAPGVPETVGPDLGTDAGAADEWVVRRDGVAARRAWGDPEHLRQHGAQTLAVRLGVTLASAVPQSDVQVPVRTEGQVAAVVVRERLA